MPLEFRSLPALTNGVSRQAPVLRLDSQAEEQVNYLSSVSEGLLDRPGTTAVAKLDPTDVPIGSFYHAIDRDADEQYIVRIPGDGTIKVWDTAGVPQTVNAPNAAAVAYLTTLNDPRETFRANSVVDTTFIAKNDVAVAIDTGTVSGVADTRALFWVKSTAAEVDIRILMHHNYTGPWMMAYQKDDDPDLDAVQTVIEPSITALATDPQPTLVVLSQGATSAASNKSSTIHTQQQAMRVRHVLEHLCQMPDRLPGPATPDGQHKILGYDLNGSSMATWETVPTITPAFLGATGLAGEYDNQSIQGSIIILNSLEPGPDADVRFIGEDDGGGAFFKVIHRVVPDLETLPKEGAPNGFNIRVEEVTGDKTDDWYVEFDKNTWVERVGYAVPLGFDADTMPHTLTRIGPSTFEFTQAPWAIRTAGDEDSAPDPDFVGKTIQEVTLYKNRLCFVFSDGVAFSESSEFFNFWPTTVRQLLDTDAFSLTIDGGSSVPQYKHGLTYDQTLIVIGKSSQASVKGTDIFSASTVSADLVTEFDVDTRIEPLATGKTILINKPGGRGGAMLEFVPGDNVGAFDGVDITANIPNYLPTLFNSSSIGRSANIALFHADSEPANIYAYRYFFDGEGKAQSSWSRWEFDPEIFEIHGSVWFGQKCYLVGNQNVRAGSPPHNTFLVLLCMDFAIPDDPAMGYSIRLDAKQAVPINLYNATFDWSEGFSSGGYGPLVNDLDLTFKSVLGAGHGPEIGKIVPSLGMGGANKFVFQGEYPIGSTVWVGYSYPRKYVPSEFRIKETTQTAVKASSAPLTNARLQLRRMKAELSDAGYLRAEVSRKGNLLSTKVFSPEILGGIIAPLAPAPEADFEFHIGTNARDVEVALINDKHIPCTINALSYEVLYHNRAQRSRG